MGRYGVFRTGNYQTSMKFDWDKLNREIRENETVYYHVPTGDGIDWTDPTHVPFMVEEVVEECGNIASMLEDQDEIRELEVLALDTMPQGKDAVKAAVKKRLYEFAEAGDWLDCLHDPITGKHHWDSDDEI